MTANPRLAALLESGEFDWDDLDHRLMYLRTWAKVGNRPFLPGGKGDE